MELDSVKNDTTGLLGERGGDASYITEDLISDFEGDSTEADIDQSGVLGNHVVRQRQTVYWKSGPVGSPDYGCQTTRNWQASASRVSVEYEGNCSTTNYTYWRIRRI
jgi:hypothetical protein